MRVAEGFTQSGRRVSHPESRISAVIHGADTRWQSSPESQMHPPSRGCTALEVTCLFKLATNLSLQPLWNIDT